MLQNYDSPFSYGNSISVFSPRGEYCGDVTARASFTGVSMVETRFARPTPVPRHRHEHAHLLLVVRGAFGICVKGRRTQLTHGEAIFHEPSEIHSGEVSSADARGFTVELTGHPNLAHLDSKGSSHGRRTKIATLLAQLYRETQIKDVAQSFAVEGLQLQLVAALMRDGAAGAATQPPPWLKQARDLLHDTSSENHTMAELSAVIGVDQKAIVRGFRKFLHTTPAEYQRSLRIDTARRSLAETSRPIAQVAADAGFCDQAYFTHQFKRACNCSPAQYRRLFGTTRSAKPERSAGTDRM